VCPSNQTGALHEYEVKAAHDEWQLYLYDAGRQWSADGQGEFFDALDDAQANGRTVGIADELIDC